MAAKKIPMPDNPFNGEQPGAIDKLTGGGATPRRPAPPIASAMSLATHAPSQAEPTPAAPPAKAELTRNVKPTSIYFTPEQLRKLDDLAYTYNGRTGKRINRNDIVRHLVDACDIGHLQGL